MIEKIKNKATKLIILLGITICLPFWIFSIQSLVTKTEKLPSIGIIFGAGVWSNGEPTWVLQHRLDKGIELYKSGQISKILVTGDNRVEFYNEPKAMKNYLIANGVSGSDITSDFAGRRTHDSCWRAKNVFNIEKAYIITQAFHIPRAIYLCQNVGIDSYTATAKNSRKYTTYWGIARELPASWLAFVETIQDYEAVIKGDGMEQDLSK